MASIAATIAPARAGVGRRGLLWEGAGAALVAPACGSDGGGDGPSLIGDGGSVDAGSSLNDGGSGGWWLLLVLYVEASEMVDIVTNISTVEVAVGLGADTVESVEMVFEGEGASFVLCLAEEMDDTGLMYTVCVTLGSVVDVSVVLDWRGSPVGFWAPEVADTPDGFSIEPTIQPIAKLTS